MSTSIGDYKIACALCGFKCNRTQAHLDLKLNQLVCKTHPQALFNKIEYSEFIPPFGGPTPRLVNPGDGRWIFDDNLKVWGFEGSDVIWGSEGDTTW